jgi:hypothetical protein
MNSGPDTAPGRGQALLDRVGGLLRRATRNAHLWLPGYVAARRRPRPRARRAWFTIADHFEPGWNHADPSTARERVARWRVAWPEIAAHHRDSTGRPPQYTFFYPQEEYAAERLQPLAELRDLGIADVDVHIHHDGEGERNFVDRMATFIEVLRSRHGLLRQREGQTVFGFIHGNWALDNARPDGRWCGLNNELTLLRDLGCYADFSLPAVPDPSQAGLVNTIYWATDDPERPRSHATGVPLVPGRSSTGDLLMIPGPLGLDWTGRRPWKPRIDTGELAANASAGRHRVALWLKVAPQLGDDVFVKLFAHGAQERHSAALLGGDLDRLFTHIRETCVEGGIEFRYVTAWEMRQAVDRVLFEGAPGGARIESVLPR